MSKQPKKEAPLKPDDVLRRMLSTPPDPRKKAVQKKPKKPAK
jgi:hypothetical protein